MQLLHTAHVPAGDGPHPTIIAVHGWGASAHDLLGLAPILHRGEAIVLCPQGPLALQVGPGVPGYGWFPFSAGAPPDPDEIARGRDLLVEFIDQAVERYPVDRSKLVLAGFSQGGFMAYLIALADPTRFAGLMALSSFLPVEIAKEIPARPEHADLPTLVVHGSEDPMIPVAMAHASRDALLEKRVPTTFREYPMGHEIAPEALRDVVRWLEEKVLSPIQLA